MPAGSSGLLVEFHAQAAEPDSPVWRHTGRTAGSARGQGQQSHQMEGFSSDYLSLISDPVRAIESRMCWLE